MADLIGIGLTYPTELTNGSWDLVTGNDLIKQSIFSILETPMGSRFFNPDFGSDINELLFEQNDVIVESLARVFIKDALEKWEKRVKFKAIGFRRETAVLYIKISFVRKDTGEEDSMIYPFYRQIKY
jgi:phage baseplate assembly protein W